MIDLPPEPVPYVMAMEYPMNDVIAVKCDHGTQDVSRAEAQLYAEALDRFLGNPKNTARVDPSFHRFVLGVRYLDFDITHAAVYHGGWKLQCMATGQLSWRMQPVANTEFTAFLGYDTPSELWRITELRIKRMQR